MHCRSIYDRKSRKRNTEMSPSLAAQSSRVRTTLSFRNLFCAARESDSARKRKCATAGSGDHEGGKGDGMEEVPHDCPGADSAQAGRGASCQGCPNQRLCASGAGATPAQIALLDIDICGPSIPKIMGLEGEQVHQSGSGWSPVVSFHLFALFSQ
nr:cytosolic Fe-S cluster assembly factor NBP35-like [Aotus nancymaae]